MSTTSYQNQAFVEEAHQDIQTDREEQRERLERASETREALESDPGQAAPYEMTPARQIGTVTHSIDGDTYQFGKPSGRATKAMLEPIQEMQDEGDSLAKISSYVWDLLGEWAIHDDHDVDFWADEVSMVDAITLARSVAMGGNAQALRL